MGEPESPLSPSSDDRRQWRRIFSALVEMVQSQQSQIETLADDRKFLEDYIRIQRNFWASRARLLESHISQMKKEEDMGRRVHSSKLNLMVGMKQREAVLYKKQLELTESDLVDFHVCVETLGAEISEMKEKLKCREDDKEKTGIDDSKTVKDLNEKEECIAALEREIRSLKHDHRKLSSKKEADISALLAEKDFVWNQFKKMDNDYSDLVRARRIDEQANETIEVLQRSLEKFQLSVDEKDEAIANLEAERARLESDVRRRTEEAEQLNEKVEKLQLSVMELQEHRKLSSKKEADISALLAEKDFVWNQFKKMENDYSDLVRVRQIEVEQANETTEVLQCCLEKLQSSVDEKDETIAKLEAEWARLDSDVRSHTEEAEQLNEKVERLQLNVEELQELTKEKDETIAKLRSDLAKFDMSLIRCTRGKSRFSKDLDSQSNSRNDSVTPRGSHPIKRSGTSSLESAEGHANRKRRCINEGSSGLRAAVKVNGMQQCSGLLQARTSTPVETPRLFSAKLKVPKLRNSSPAIV